MGVTEAQQPGNERVVGLHLRARFADDSGSSLIFVLIFIMGFSVMITALLGFSSTALTANKRATDITRQIEAADAGVELALEVIRAGAASTPGPSFTTQTISANNDRVSATIAQRAITFLCIDGPFPVSAGVTTFRVRTVACADPSTNTLPFGAVWTVSGPPGASFDNGSGRLTFSDAGSYTIRVQVGNVSATKVVSLP